MAVNLRIIREIFTTFTCESCKKRIKHGFYIGLHYERDDRKYFFCKICYGKLIEKIREKHGGVCSTTV